jgi:protein-arginine kinase activator protein McsA
MNCQRCQANEAGYRVYTDIMNLEVCSSCAIKAVEVGIAVEALPRLRTDHQPSDVLNGDLPLNSAA